MIGWLFIRFTRVKDNEFSYIILLYFITVIFQKLCFYWFS
jgi:hypothetical protein